MGPKKETDEWGGSWDYEGERNPTSPSRVPQPISGFSPTPVHHERSGAGKVTDGTDGLSVFW